MSIFSVISPDNIHIHNYITLGVVGDVLPQYILVVNVEI